MPHITREPPPHPPSAPSPPAEKRWGRRALDGRALPRVRGEGLRALRNAVDFHHPPNLQSRRCRRRTRGAFTRQKRSCVAGPWAASKPESRPNNVLVQRPFIRLPHLAPHLQSPGGGCPST